MLAQISFHSALCSYEMLTGVRAFSGDSTFNILSRVVHHTPTEICKLRSEVPRAIARVVRRCLEKDPARRYSSGRELADAFVQAEQLVRSGSRALRMATAVAATSIVLIGIALWWQYRNQHLRWARDEALPKIQALTLQSDYFGAFKLTRAALHYDPDNGQLKQHWQNVSLPLTMTTEPSGANAELCFGQKFACSGSPHVVGTPAI